MVEINYLKSIINDILKQYKNLIRLSLDNEEHDFTNLTSRVKMLYLKAQHIMIFFSKQQLDTLYFNAKGNILNPNLIAAQLFVEIIQKSRLLNPNKF